MHKNLLRHALNRNAIPAGLAWSLSSGDKGRRNEQPEPVARAPR